MKIQQHIGDAIVGLVLCISGLVWLQMSWALGLGTVREPGPGFFPAAVAIGLAVGGLGCTLRALRHPDSEGARPWMEAPAAKAVALIVLLCVLLAVAGFIPCALVFLFAMMRWVGGVKTIRAATVSVLATIAFWLVFDRLLSVQLPIGIF
ncbi:tripartite tricarboxylate transporter TctB family protein [Castellaniella sp.]|uniref:tripartite tricarboxylate transporter TctB family protein n=1 Tax=Castellaniella sp. TaxID=1955812 RepID=UPI003C75C6DA